MLFQRSARSLAAFAPAKLNLHLAVLGRRPDGYHELETLLVSIGLYDRLDFSPLPDREIALTVEHAADFHGVRVPVGDSNLVVRAARLLQQATGTDAGVAIRLLKRIPSEAGLGGGSSDAAATLVALNRLWQTGLSPAELSELAGLLGSDVPFFLAPTGLAICRGRGERVEPLPARGPWHFVIVKPPSGLSTARVFSEWRDAGMQRTADALTSALGDGPAAIGRRLYNALSPAAMALNEEVALLERLFRREPVLGHSLTGSGTCYFGLCANRTQARRLAGRLRHARAGEVFVAQSRV